MGLSVERNGYDNLQNMGFDIASDLQFNGFNLIAVDKLAGNSRTQASSEYLFEPTLAVDPLSGEEDQPWRLMLEFNDDGGYINIWVITPQQVLPGFVISSYDDKKESGRLSKDNSSDTSGKAYFFSNSSQKNYWSCYGSNSVDQEAIPLSYRLTISDHGVFLSTWAESYDSSGDCFNWLLIQRPVTCNTGAIVVDGKAPLFCMFSQYGNSNKASLNNITTTTDSILHFIVRENDINAPVPPMSSVVPTADSYPLINPIQQVALMEDGSFTLRMPQGFTTARHLYDHKLDLVTFTSADVLSNTSEPRCTMFGESSLRTYKALNANFPENTGMRMLCQIAGKGIT